MENPIEPIFSEWLEEHGETVKTITFCNDFCKDDNAEWAFSDVLEEERRESFTAGFKTAIRLLIG